MKEPGLWELNTQRADGKHYECVLSRIYAAGLRDAQHLTNRLFSTDPAHVPFNFKGIEMTTVIVFSRLRWDFVYQRPQHLLSRWGKNCSIIFIEEPVFHEHDSFMESSSPVPNITVLKPHTPVDAPGFHDEQLPHLIKLMRQSVSIEEDHIVWFYTPMALPLLQELNPALVVYDCAWMSSPLSKMPRSRCSNGKTPC